MEPQRDGEAPFVVPLGVPDKVEADVENFTRYKSCVECGQPFPIPAGTSYGAATTCERRCNTVLPCGHKCAGRCGECVSFKKLHDTHLVPMLLPDSFMMGVAHHPCMEVCNRNLPCGHLCEEFCCQGCPPCSHVCTCIEDRERIRLHNRKQREREITTFDTHTCSSCPFRGTCLQPCEWACPHYTCPNPCGDPCQRPPCNRRCTKTLPGCGHQCVGLCSEICPSLCPACYRGEGGEERKKEQHEWYAKKVYIDDVFVYDETLSAYCNGEEWEAVEEAVMKERYWLMQQESEQEKEEEPFSPSESCIMRPIEMPCCHTIVCVAYLDRYYAAQDFSHEEQQERTGKAFELPKCPFCRAVLLYPCEHRRAPHTGAHPKGPEEGQEEAAAWIGSENKEGFKPKRDGGPDGCIFRYSRLIKQQTRLLKKIFDSQTQWLQKMREENMRSIRIVMRAIRNPFFFKEVESGKGTGIDYEKAFEKDSIEDADAEESFKLRRRKLEMLQHKKNGRGAVERVWTIWDRKENKDIWNVKQWREAFLSLVGKMKMVLDRSQYDLSHTDSHCLAWYILLIDLTNPSIKEVAGAIINMISSLQKNEWPEKIMDSSTPLHLPNCSSGKRRFVARLQRTIEEYSSCLLRRIFTLEAREAQILAITMEWLRIVMLSFSPGHKSIRLNASTNITVKLLVQHRNFFKALYLPPPENFLAQYGDMPLQELRVMIDEAKEKYFNEVDMDFLRGVSKAIGLSAGHFFACQNGHVFTIGECGGAMEKAICPECKEIIGGLSHALEPNCVFIGHLIDPGASMSYPTTTNYA